MYENISSSKKIHSISRNEIHYFLPKVVKYICKQKQIMKLTHSPMFAKNLTSFHDAEAFNSVPLLMRHANFIAKVTHLSQISHFI